MKRFYHFRAIAVSGLVAVGMGLSMGTASAAQQEITITPTSVRPAIKPGATYHGLFQVLNQGKTPYNFQVYAAPYHVSGEDYTPEFTPLPHTTPVKNWFTLASSGGHANPGQTITVHYSISVPANAAPGGYYAAVFAQTRTPKGNSITLNERVGELFYIHATGPVVQKGSVVSWQAAFLQKPPLEATLRLSDSGGLDYPATIQVNVRDVFGHSKYGLYSVKEVLPQTIRRIDIPWQKAPAFGIFKVTGSVKFLGKTHALATKWVLVMSAKVRWVLLIIVLVLIGLFVLRYGLRRRAASKPKQP